MSRIIDVIRGATHKYYQRTVKVAEYARMMNTGVGQDELLAKKYPNDSKAHKKQRKNLTTHITKSVCHSVHAPIDAMPKSPSIHVGYSWDEGNEEKTEILEGVKDTYNGKYNFDQHWNTDFTRLNKLDPNAFKGTEIKTIQRGC